MQPLQRLSAAMAHPDPREAMERALRIASELGIVPCEDQRDTWTTLEHAGRTLALCARTGLPGEPELWRNLLQSAFSRAVEHEQLLHTQERASLLSAASFEGLFFHVDGWVVDVNQRLLELSGYERDEVLGDQLMKRCIAPESQGEVRQRVLERYEGAYVIGAVRKDGRGIRVELQAKQGTLGDPPMRVVAVRDVTERERSENLLREGERRLRNLIETAFDLTVFTENGVAVDALGRRLESVTGKPREELLGAPIVAYIPERLRAEVIRDVREERTGVRESLLLSSTGEEVPVEIVTTYATLEGRRVRVSAMRDLREQKRQESERRALERAFERSQRLDSLGVLAGGIAHDFNNLLTAILGHADLLERQLQDSGQRELARAVIDAAQRAADLTSQLLAYAGRGEVGPRAPLDVSALVRELRRLLDAALSKKAQVVLSLSEQCVVLANRATLTQVIMNLLTNASDALLDHAGTIRVKTALVEEPDARWALALGRPVAAGSWVLLEVSDTGQGMDEATQTRIFEPFFSTKPKGHGLGLAACVGIVSSHGGAMQVASEPGRGSTFSVLLPRHVPGEPVKPRSDSTPKLARIRSVLVVDDEPMVRSHLRNALSMRGYEVLEADSGSAALAILEKRQPSVVLLDMTMPDLSGAEVLRRIRQNGWEVPVVLSSGFHDVALDQERDQFQGFLLKPYKLSELFQTIERASDQ